jgi:hypothetical protein
MAPTPTLEPPLTGGVDVGGLEPLGAGITEEGLGSRVTTGTEGTSTGAEGFSAGPDGAGPVGFSTGAEGAGPEGTSTGPEGFSAGPEGAGPEGFSAGPVGAGPEGAGPVGSGSPLPGHQVVVTASVTTLPTGQLWTVGGHLVMVWVV